MNTSTPIKTSMRNEFCSISYENGMLDIIFFEGHEIDQVRAYQFMDMCFELTKNEPHCSISFAEPGVSYTREARRIFANADTNLYASALLANSPGLKLTANFFLKINRPIYPTRFFTSRTEALNWLDKITKTTLPKV